MHRQTQPVGRAVPGWTARPRPERASMRGRFCQLEPLEAGAHADALFDANADDADGRMWTYLPYGPFASRADHRAWIEAGERSEDPLFFAIVDHRSSRAAGVAAYQRVDQANGVIEIGHLAFSPGLQRTAAATEAMYLMLCHVFDRGYRRCEWKCDALNAPSRAAAARLGFAYEGTFRQAVVVKGRNRDTAWYSIIDTEWPACRAAFERWLAPGNFDAEGRQRSSLAAART